jgi:hypothetical protein
MRSPPTTLSRKIEGRSDPLGLQLTGVPIYSSAVSRPSLAAARSQCTTLMYPQCSCCFEMIS